MSIIRKRFLWWINSFVGMLLTCLGYGCKTTRPVTTTEPLPTEEPVLIEQPVEPPVVMYGVPPELLSVEEKADTVNIPDKPRPPVEREQRIQLMYGPPSYFQK